MGEPVYKQFDQDALDAQYNLRARHPDFQSYFDGYEEASERTRAALDCRLDVSYGDTPLQAVDVFPARAPGAPVLVFIHGGYWQSLDKRQFSFPAGPAVQAGAAVVSVNYDLAPAVTMDRIVEQCRHAVAWSAANAADFNGDPQRLHVAGHSAGGHLTLMMVLTDWTAHGLPADLVKGTCAISGLYDLEPVRRSYLNETLRMDADMARRNSPLYLLGRRGPPLIAAVGAGETDEFRRQNGMLATALRARGVHCDEMTLPGQHHFNIVQALDDPQAPLTRALLAQLGL